MHASSCGQGRAFRGQTPPAPPSSSYAQYSVDGSTPDTIGPYSLLRKLGSGGQATVWLAEDTRLRRKVALKLLQTEHGPLSRDKLARFRREAEAVSKLDHPNICALLDASETDGLACLAFRYVEGTTLAEWIAQTIKRRAGLEAADPESPSDPIHTDPSSREGIKCIAAMFEKLARALQRAHEHGLVHRDVKPGNVMITPDGEPVLLDFGLARDELASQDGLTLSGALVGTPAYMSPEQLVPRRVPPDRRADVYSLGATLYEALTLQRPFDDTTPAELYQRILHSDPAPAISLNRQIPRDLLVVLQTAMEKDRNRRYQTAQEFADDLRRYLQFEPIRARPIGRLLRLKRWGQRHPAAAVTIASLGALLAVTLGFLWEQADKVKVERGLREQGIRTAALLAARSVAIEVELRWRILESAAASAELQRALVGATDPAATTGAADRAPLRHLQQWVEDRYRQHSGATKAVSWFITGRDGTQLARAPFSELSIGANFSFRDYFHGRGRDQETAEASELTPIRDVHRSNVFRSTVTENLMVAFSVPVRVVPARDALAQKGPQGVVEAASSADAARSAVADEVERTEAAEVVGVLAMTVEIGRFGILQLGLQAGQVAALVDTRQDWSGQHGLILHHPRLAELRLEQHRLQGGELPIWYAPAERVSRFVALREGRVAQERQRATMPWEEQLLMVGETGLETFDPDYRDPVHDEPGDTWFAAFEPVLVSGRPEKICDTGWVVVVQERRRP